MKDENGTREANVLHFRSPGITFPIMPTVPPCVLVSFGASGDLAHRKLIPAIYEMAREKLLPEQFSLVGFARTEISDEEFRKNCRESVQKFARTKPVDPAIWDRVE